MCEESEDMVDIESWEKCPHGYYINPESPELIYKITGEDGNGDLEAETCERCFIDQMVEVLISQGEDPEEVKKFSDFQKSKVFLNEVLNGSLK